MMSGLAREEKNVFSFSKRYSSAKINTYLNKVFIAFGIQSCLLKSMILSKILRINNIPHNIMIGTCINDSEFSSHSWIDIFDDAESVSQYKIIKKFHMNDLLVEIDLSYIAEKKELPSYLKNVFYSDNGSQYICLYQELLILVHLKKHKFDQNWHDSKVLIELYRKIGNKFVDELIGGFTIIILDTSNMFSIIFRDHFGLLPAYFCCNKNKLILSSSIKNILKKYPEQKKISNQSVIDLILFMGTEHDKTFFRNVRQIPKGHFLFYSKDRLQLFKHYNFNKIKKPIYKNEDEYFDQFRYLFEIRFLVNCLFVVKMQVLV